MSGRITTLEAVQAVVDQPDPILRNLLITLSYHDFAAELAARVCAQNATWVAFAAWASKQAGRFIRLEALPEHFGPLRDLLERIDGVVDEISAHISEGNSKVYRELAPLFARFIAELDAQADDTRFAQFLATLRPGPSEEEGQDHLRHAFTALREAARTRDPRTRAQLIFLANAHIGVHEQTRLQAQIEGGLMAALDRVRRLSSGWLELAPALVRRTLGALSWRVDQLWRALGTDVMSIALPEGQVVLSRPTPRLADRRMYPEHLEIPDLPALVDLLVEWDPTPLSTAQSEADDWSDLADRMHFILELFRSRQQTPEVLQAPFDPHQLAQLRAGLRPHGPL